MQAVVRKFRFFVERRQTFVEPFRHVWKIKVPQRVGQFVSQRAVTSSDVGNNATLGTDVVSVVVGGVPPIELPGNVTESSW